ncbi:hypothetical protein Trco_003720 [Trichoderma cornu-damae]|uniref:Uncharacterized protein n=1 Tax=Trichoderma cornu-damae TaxID=654480 RepID=A0A9P8QRW3_9HYPO|nr:hypothetical protein Trco_003720 [Trichoderma cornu-damae]
MDSGNSNNNNNNNNNPQQQQQNEPINEASVDPKFAAHKAHPGPVMMAQQMPPQQGTKEERQARKEELNK